jgi:hypothetical protein
MHERDANGHERFLFFGVAILHEAGNISDEPATSNQMKRTTAIVTKYLGPTNHKGSRIKATLSGDAPSGESPPSVTVPFDYSLPHGYREHEPAAKALIEKIANMDGWRSVGWRDAQIVAFAYLGDSQYVFSVSLFTDTE